MHEAGLGGGHIAKRLAALEKIVHTITSAALGAALATTFVYKPGATVATAAADAMGSS